MSRYNILFLFSLCFVLQLLKLCSKKWNTQCCWFDSVVFVAFDTYANAFFTGNKALFRRLENSRLWVIFREGSAQPQKRKGQNARSHSILKHNMQILG